MDKIKQFFSKFKLKKDKKTIKTSTIKPSFIADLLTIIAFIIIFFTTFTLNIYISMYVLAIELIIFSYFVSRNGGES